MQSLEALTRQAAALVQGLPTIDVGDAARMAAPSTVPLAVAMLAMTLASLALLTQRA